MDKTTAKTVGLARHFRRSATPQEKILWDQLRRRSLAHCKFRRQHPIGPYVLDFYCAALKLAIELDGAPHKNAIGQEHDELRTGYLSQLGIMLLRFDNERLLLEPELVDREIRTAIRLRRGY